ncbi:MAG: DNA topoisomerase (ATP-hydrolyzing) [Ruminococcus sp.]|nr:DNA topoisomerase (ATP-hydrolyzing) [Ruminococcus sp.]
MEGQIIRTEYSEVMQKSYIDYAMSVIIARALPDVRDGLKPVQRRTLYDMYELGIRYDRPYRKCARIVGDTMGKYHPHGDSSIYDALVVLAQDFKKGQTLVDGHGNFGSIEGDGAAAMRYTEARLEKITQEVYLSDMDKAVVDFMPNFDETEKEPVVLPVRVPNLLLNGAEGIAVGMATSIPPHNLCEIVDAVKAYMKNNEITVKELMKYIKGPDFPTGGIVINQDDLLQIYETGVGKIKLRGKVEVEQLKGGKCNLVITEIPYTMIGANIGKFLNDVAALVENKKAPEIVDISNQSSKEGIRIVLELKKGADVENLKNMLYKKTRLEDTFGVNMLAVADGRPETLSLKQIIEHHVDFQFEVCTRKHQTLLNKELDKKEVQEGLIKAVDVIDLIIEILRGSKNQKQVKDCLVSGITEGIKFKTKTSERAAKKLRFTERQATAILEMRLYKLIGLEMEALLAEHEETLKNIALYEDILNNYDSMAQVIIKDLEKTKKAYGKERRTVIENAQEAVFEEKKVEETEVCFVMDRFGYAKTMDKSIYERNKETIHNEYKYVFTCMNTDKICLFTDKGQMHTVKAMDLPLARLRDKGTPIDNVSNYTSAQEQILFVASMEMVKNETLMFITKGGMLKQVEGQEFDVAKRTIAATKLAEDDCLILVGLCNTMDYVVLQSKDGYFLRFLKNEIPDKKKTAIGVRGMKLGENDWLEHAYLIESRIEYSIEYKEKQLSLNKLKLAKRDTKGVKVRV